jgi:hypothetical protein
LLETLTKCYRKRNDVRGRIGFLHREKPRYSSNNNDEDEDALDDTLANDSDSYYGNSDKSDSDDDDGEDKDISIKNKRLHAQQEKEKDLHSSIKPDWKLIRLLLRTMVNLIQSATLQIFPMIHRKQLLTFLAELRIGEEGEGREEEEEEEVLGWSMIELVAKDRVVDVYYSILQEQANLDVSAISALKAPVDL